MADEHRRGRRGAPTSLRTAAVQVSVQALAADRQQALGRPLRVLDLGGGTGGLAVPLAEQGHHVTVVDPSPDALASLSRRVADAGVADRVTAVQGEGNDRRPSISYNPMNTAACSAVAATNITSRGSAAVTMNCCPNAPARNPTIDFARPPIPTTPLDSESWISPAALPASIPPTGPVVSAT